MNSKPLAIAWLSVAVVAGLGAWGWVLDPSHSPRWVLVVLCVPALWGFVELVQAGDSRQDKEAIMDWHRRVFAFTSLMIAIGLSFKLAISTGLLDAAWEPVGRRARGVMLGIGLAVWGNYLPKLLSPWSLENEPFDWQQVHRFGGRVALIGGVAVMMAWLALPMEAARIATFGITAAFVVLVGGRKFLSLATRSRRRPPTTPPQARQKDDAPSLPL